MEPSDHLLQRFEAMIDLPAFLSSRGYQLSTQQPSEDHIAMTKPADGAVLLLQRDQVRGGWTYSDVRSPADRGSVAQYLERKEGLDRRQCLELLIACADERRRDMPEAVRYRAHRREKPEDLRLAETSYHAATERRRSAEKLLERLGVASRNFDEWRFGRVRGDSDVYRLLSEPSHGVWTSRYRPSDRKLVLVERPIDAIAYEQKHGNQEACYIATGSAPSESTKRRLAHVLADVRGGMEVVVGYGTDRRGQVLEAQVRSLAPMVQMTPHRPSLGNRWAEGTQMEARHQRSRERDLGKGPDQQRSFR